MSSAVALIKWTVRRELFGPDSGAAQAAFGRYVAAKGGVLSARATEAAKRAYVRSYRPGHMNRAARFHLALTPGRLTHEGYGAYAP